MIIITRRLNLINKQFGKLKVVGFSYIKNEKSYFLCECDCENKTKLIVRGSDLKSGRQKSCGCSRLENVKRGLDAKDSIHGMRRSRIYKIWCGMKQRCDNTKDSSYERYGGRGISYDISWSKFENFYNDMKNNYAPDLTLDRKDNNGNYNKDNCRWATAKTQSNNKRTNIIITINNISKTITQWTEFINRSRSYFHNIYRTKYGDNKNNYLERMTYIIKEELENDKSSNNIL